MMALALAVVSKSASREVMHMADTSSIVNPRLTRVTHEITSMVKSGKWWWMFRGCPERTATESISLIKVHEKIRGGG
jgi:hypothetical protein